MVIKKFKKIIVFVLFLFCCSIKSGWSQNKVVIDSLEKLLPNTKDTLRVTILNELCLAYGINDTIKSLSSGNEALQLAEKLNFKIGKAQSLTNIGHVYRKLGNYEKALDYFSGCLSIAKEINNQKAIGGAYNNIGMIYERKGQYENALTYYFDALKIKEQMGDSRGMASTLNNIGIIYKQLSNYQLSLDYYFKALEINRKTNNNEWMGNNLMNIGNIYKARKQYEEAMEYYQNAIQVYEGIGEQKLLAYCYISLGNICSEDSNLTKATIYYSKALKIQQKLGDNEGLVYSYQNMGRLSSKLNQNVLAIGYLKKATAIAREINSKSELMGSYELVAELFFKTNDYKNAYEYHLLYSEIKDSIFNEESSKQITEMQTKYDTEKKEQQIKLLNKDKEIQTKDLQRQKTIRNAVAGGLLLVLLFSFVLINRLLLIRKQKKVIEIEREKSEKLLLNILPKEIAEELKINNSVTPQFYKLVTVMFTDFKGFTTIAEKMSAEELVSELDFIFKKFDEIISKYPIEKIKTIGDAYMCAGGLPVANATNPMDVVMAGLEIQEWMKAQNKWQLRLGIHTGSVIAGVVGDKKFAYDIWGDTVNTASRMESSGEVGKVNISGETYRLLVGAIHESPLRFKFRGKIPAKNKGEIEMYFVEKKG